MKWLHHYPKEINAFLLASLINAAGSSLMWPLVAMFVFDGLERPMANAGFVILIHAVGGIAGQLLGGMLYHRVGVKRLVVCSLAISALGLFLLPASSGTWPLFVLLMGLIGLFNSLSLPAIQAFIGFRFTERRGELFNVIYVANNIGVAIGTALSGFLAQISYSLSFILNGVTSAIFALFFLIYLNKVEVDHRSTSTARKPAKLPSDVSAWLLIRNINIYLYMAVAILLLNAGNSMWNTGVSPFIISEGMSKELYGFLWTINGVLIFVGQPIIRLLKLYLTRTITSQMTASSIFYAAGYSCVLVMPTYPGMVLGMIIATFGEMLIAPALPAYLSEHAGKHTPFYIGLAGGIGQVGRVVGPFVMGSMFDHGGLPPVAWLAVITAVASTLFFIIHSAVNSHRHLNQQSGKQGHSPAAL